MQAAQNLLCNMYLNLLLASKEFSLLLKTLEKQCKSKLSNAVAFVGPGHTEKQLSY